MLLVAYQPMKTSSLHLRGTPTKQGTSDILDEMSFWYHCKEHSYNFNLIPKTSSYSSYFLKHYHLCLRL